jgi:hypothetical protein
VTLLACLCAIAVLAPTGAAAGNGNWWDVEPEAENPSPYYDSILYSEIAPKLREIELNSNRVRVEVIGQSAGGRDMYFATVSAPEAIGRLGTYQAISKTMLKDPEKALDMIEKLGDFKVPVFINGSIHGDENPGTDAAIRLIETLAYGDDPETLAILDNVILLVNVVANPDGRVMYTRRNANGFDINRDFIAQTQPETKAMVEIFTEWNPMVVLDLHGFVDPMLIEPCTPPHNPNYEYDLYLKWALDQSYAMEASLFANTLETQTIIPYRDWDFGWDDWPPSYVPMYAMYHGAYGHTLETPHEDERGVDAHYWAVWGALEFVSENRAEMLADQIEIFRRGFLDLPQVLIPEYLLDETEWDQYNELTIQEFPAAYVIPKEMNQPSSHQAARLVDFLLFNDVEVEQASNGFELDGTWYPAGSYVVWMDQPKRGLANTILDAGLDLSGIEGLEFYSPPSAWSHPLLWGTYREVMDEPVDIDTHPVTKADPARGSAEGGVAAGYWFEPTSLAAFQAVNELLERGETVYLVDGNFMIPGDASLANELANSWALDLQIGEIPTDAVLMEPQSIAIYGDEGLEHALQTLGFDFDAVGRSDLNEGAIAGYDLFINDGLRWSRLDGAGQASMSAFFADGGDYVGLGYLGRAIAFANHAGITDVEYEGIDGDGIVEIVHNGLDPLAAGFLQDDYALVYRSVWFTGWEGLEVTASIGDGILVAGFWEDWESSGAGGMPIVIHTDLTEDSDVVLIGYDATFRGHPENTFRMLGNAIFAGLDG